MNRIVYTALALAAGLFMNSACDAKKDPVTGGREAVKEVVTQPFNTLESAKDALKQSEEKSKAALEKLEKEANP